MKRQFLLLFTLLSLSFSGFSQDLVLRYGEQIVNDDTLRFSGTKQTDLIETKLSVTNNRQTSVSLKVRRTDITIVEGAEASFCWGECYTPAVLVSPRPLTILAGATDRSSFVAELRPFETEGTSVVKYSFFDPADSTLVAGTTLIYEIGASGIDLNDAGTPAISLFPNPADRDLRIRFSGDLSQDREITVYNLGGVDVLHCRIPAGQSTLALPVRELPNGIYFIRSVVPGGSARVGKLVVRH